MPENAADFGITFSTGAQATSQGVSNAQAVGLIPPPNASAPVLSSTISNGAPLNLPTGATPETGAGLVAGTIAGNAAVIATGVSDYTQDPNVIAAEQKYEQGITDYTKEANATPSHASLQTAAETAQGVPEMQKQLASINTQLAERTAAFNNDIARTETLGIESGQSAVFYQGEIAAKRRQQAVEIGGLAAVKAAIEGNFDLALSRATQVANLQFEDAERKIQNTLQFLQLNESNLNRAEKNAAARIEAKAKGDLAKLNEQKDARTFALTYGIQSQFYELNGTVYRTSDGYAMHDPAEAQSLGVNTGNWSNVQHINPQEFSQVAGLAEQFPDARINPATDTLAQAQNKIGSSRIYQDAVRGPVGSGGGGGSAPAVGDDPQLYAGLTSATATAVRAGVNQFKTEPLVQNFAVIQDGYNFASSLSNNTQNPADDQALIYSLAKALDPGSVVREGEYATAQKYSQSWINAYGKGVTQAIAGTGFLSETARKNIKATIKQKYAASKKSYDNLYNQYSNNIGTLTGRSDGTSFLKDYSTQATTVETSTDNSQPIQQERGFWSNVGNWLFGD